MLLPVLPQLLHNSLFLQTEGKRWGYKSIISVKKKWCKATVNKLKRNIVDISSKTFDIRCGSFNLTNFVFIPALFFKRKCLCEDSVFQAVAPRAASRGNRLLTLLPSSSCLSSSPPLPCILPGCRNAAACWSVSGFLSRTELLKTLGWGRRRQSALLAASDEPPLPPCQCGGKGERGSARLRDSVIERERERATV